MSDAATLTASLEDYLEAIFHIVARKKAARAKDIAERMAVSSSSVTGALHSLADRNLVNYAPYDIVTLTDSGREAAEDVVRRHRALRDFFVKILAVDDGIAEKGACRMEHAVPRELVDRFISFVEFVEACPGVGPALIERFSQGCRPGRDGRSCDRCVFGPLGRVQARTPCRRDQAKLEASDS